MTTDTVSDALIRLKNAARARNRTTQLPATKGVRAILTVLKREGYIDTIGEPEKHVRLLPVRLRYRGGVPAFHDIRRQSKPGNRVYLSLAAVRRRRHLHGTDFLSTPQGIMTGNEARKKNLGGEFLCTIVS